MGYFISIVIGYLFGCSNMAFYLAKLRGEDFRKAGSGNLGASNATVLLGWRAGILVGVHDFFKATIAVLLAKLLFPELEHVGAVAGVAAVWGHIFPFFLKFKGSKGFASYLGMAFALHWKFTILIMLAVVLITLISDYIVIGTMTTVFSVPAYLGITQRNWIIAVILLAGTAVIVFKHWENFGRILNGTEIGLRSTIKGKNRVK